MYNFAHTLVNEEDHVPSNGPSWTDSYIHFSKDHNQYSVKDTMDCYIGKRLGNCIIDND